MNTKIRNIGFAMLMLLLIASFESNAQDKYNADANKSTLEWLGEKVSGEHKGTLLLKSGSVEMKDNKLLAGEFVIDMQSIKCSDITNGALNAKLVGHLKSEDFFSVEKNPEATFVIESSESFSKGSALVKGKLTIKGKTHPIAFKASMQSKKGKLHFYAKVIVDRTKYDVKYGSGSFFDNLGDKTIYDDFTIKLNLVMKQ